MNRQLSKECPFAVVGVDGVRFTLGAKIGDVRNVSIQALDMGGVACGKRVALTAYISNDAKGDTLATAPTTVAIGTAGLAIKPISNSLMKLVTNAAGVVDINITKAGAATYYIVVVLPSGRLQVSSALVFAA